MNNDVLTKLLSEISAPSFFSFLQKVDTERFLAARDEPSFDSVWTAHFHRLEKVIVDSAQLPLIDKIREAAFKSSFLIAEDPELSALICDDFELIAKALASGNEQDWPVTYLLACYCNGKLAA